MPVTKQDALRALQLLVELRNGSDDAAAAHYDALIDVMQSKLFVALLELQDFYFDKVVHRAATRERQSVASSKSRASYGELEWEDDYDFGGQPGNNDGRPQSVQRAASAQLVEVRMEEVELTAGSRGLGMSISGGVDRPFVPEDTSIFITNITPGGAADQTSILRAGDSIVSINGVSMEGKTHADAVVLLKSGPSLHLVVLHGALAASRSKMRMQTSTASLINVHQETIDLHRQEGKGLGFTIAGGVGSPHVAGDDGIFVSKIIAQSVAERDGRLTVGDRLLSVQGQSCHGLSHEQAVSLLRSPASPIVLVVEHGGFDKAANELGSSLGLKQAAGPQLTRTGTLKAFGQLKHGEQGQHDSPFDQPDGGALRKVTLTKGAYGFGFNLVGPTDLAVQDPNEAKGIFISRVMPQGAAAESGQVFEGDEIVTLNGHELTTAPYRKALALIRSIPDGVMQLQLRSNPKVYNVYKERMAALQANEVETKQSLTAYNSKDGLCVRALYEYNPAQDMTLGSKERKRKLLSVQLHDVYLVPQVSTGDWWEAENLNTGDKGLIPSRSLAETKVQTGKQLDGNGTEAQQEAVLVCGIIPAPFPCVSSNSRALYLHATAGLSRQAKEDLLLPVCATADFPSEAAVRLRLGQRRWLQQRAPSLRGGRAGAGGSGAASALAGAGADQGLCHRQAHRRVSSAVW
eukprot:TRINITY_DN11356_c0_g1_i3.p1 TRINITY_DN11356_c0_g1~~TRINITY_DN11356_c0_g1_i3.p1  ORF type:complete len:689 (+),score=172.59 TRINITY_DN11356_c0_g1_i3:83-2149(+)